MFFNDINKLEEFRFKVQKVFPAIYDDTLSYYELLSKVIAELNKIAKSTNGLIDGYQEVVEWLMSGGITQDVYDRFDELVAQGHFDGLVNPMYEYPITKFGGIPDHLNKGFINNKAIQDTIDYVHSIGGGCVVIPDGTYYVDGNQPIILRNNVTIKGVQRDNSIIKIKTGTGDWGELFTHDNTWISNVSFLNLTMDTNIQNTVGLPVAWVNHRTFINGGEGDNWLIDNCKFITNGIWVIHADLNNTILSNNEIVFDGTNYNSGWFDISSFWLGGENNFIHHNTFTTKNMPDFSPETCIEFQGHNFHVHDNICLKYTNGILPTPSTSYDNPLQQLSGDERGIKVYNNTIEAANKGIFVWSMWANDLENMMIYNNTIRIDTTLPKGHSEPNAGIDFKMKTPTWNIIADINNMRIFNNYIEFVQRNVNESLYSGDAGIKVYTSVNFTGLEIYNNTFKNIGGNGITLHVDTSYDKIIKNTIIKGNTFKECRLPIWISRNVQGLIIEGNIFQQTSFYTEMVHNMIRTIYSVNGTYTLNRDFTIKDNTIQTEKRLKPYYPMYDMSAISTISYYPWDKGFKLEGSVQDNPMILEPPSGYSEPIIVATHQTIKRNNNKYYKPAFNYPNTLGTIPYTTIKQWLSNSMLRVSDVSKLKTNMTISLPAPTYFKSYVFLIEAIVDDVIITSSGLGAALVDGVSPDSVIGQPITLYSDLAQTIVGEVTGKLSIDSGSFNTIDTNHNLGGTPSFVSLVPANEIAYNAGIKYITADSTQVHATVVTPSQSGLGKMEYYYYYRL